MLKRSHIGIPASPDAQSFLQNGSSSATRAVTESTSGECRVEGDSSRLAIIAIVVSPAGGNSSIEKLNGLFHQYSNYIIGRMGLPYKPKNVNLVSVALDAPGDKINALSGQIGRLPGLKVKTLYA